MGADDAFAADKRVKPQDSGLTVVPASCTEGDVPQLMRLAASGRRRWATYRL
jgi:hypothetical protein